MSKRFVPLVCFFCKEFITDDGWRAIIGKDGWVYFHERGPDDCWAKAQATPIKEVKSDNAS